MDYSAGIASSRDPGNISLNVLEDVYSHEDSWNSFELVEPARYEAQQLPSRSVFLDQEAPTQAPQTYPTTKVTAEECSVTGSKTSCNARQGCKWKSEACIRQSRTLEEPGCAYAYDPTEFDVPASAKLLACTPNTVTFELVEDNIVTRFNVVLSHHMRRKRQLRGSW
jgi:hypothetical protein